MQSLNDALFLLEKTFKRLEAYVQNLESENNFLAEELSNKEEAVHYFSKYKKVTLEKLKEIKKALSEEIQSDIKVLSSKKINHPHKNNLNILMVDDESLDI